MVGRYRSIDRDYQGQLSRRLRSRVLMHAYAQRTRNRCSAHYVYAIAKKEKGSDRNRCFATATDINRCSVARSIEVTMVGRYRSIDRDYQGQLSRRLRSRVLMHAYAQRTRNLLVRCAIISRQLGQGRQRSGGSPLFMINHRSSYIMLMCMLIRYLAVLLLSLYTPVRTTHAGWQKPYGS